MRYLRTIDAPTQKQVLEGTCGMRTEMLMNQVCYAVHWGEDGQGYSCEYTRTFLIEEQNLMGADFQPWFYNELMEMENDND